MGVKLQGSGRGCKEQGRDREVLGVRGCEVVGESCEEQGREQGNG